MVGGQALDLRAEGADLSAPELDRLHGLKTGALLTASLRIGALAAGPPKSVLEALDTYGRSVGLAFQIADDVLDATATAADLGKNPSDAQHDKNTYVSVHGIEAAATRAPRLLPVETLTRGPSQLAGLLGLGSTEEAPFEIALTSGRVVRVPQRFDRLGLRVLLEVLEA